MMASLSILRNRRWIPLGILVVGAFFISGAGRQQSLPLEASLGSVVPTEIAGYAGVDDWISPAEAEVAGFSNYLFRVYDTPLTPADVGAAGPDSMAAHPDSAPAQPDPVAALPDSTGAHRDSASVTAEPSGPRLHGFSLYVGFYESQAEGKTIHSPKNCLPGNGYEALSSEPLDVRIGERTETVNRYILQNEDNRFLALYWYQGRGRVAHNEYRVKWNLLVDAAIHHRSDEALVRIIVPIPEGMDDEATDLAIEVARDVLPKLERALPR